MIGFNWMCQRIGSGLVEREKAGKLFFGSSLTARDSRRDFVTRPDSD